jgi:exportin-5
MFRFMLNTPSLLEPLLLFCNTILRVRDTRSVTTSIRILRHILPLFRNADSPIRAFFSDTIFKSAISSLHEPYFVDCQKDLATLIAAIVLADETSARNILLSLSDLSRDHERVDRKLLQLRNSKRGDERLQRSIVLDLLQGLRGVSIHELGKVDRGKPKQRTAFQEQYMGGAQGGGMQVEQARIVRGGSPGLEGVAGMFGDS